MTRLLLPALPTSAANELRAKVDRLTPPQRLELAAKTMARVPSASARNRIGLLQVVEYITERTLEETREAIGYYRSGGQPNS